MPPTTAQLIAHTEFLEGRYEVFADQVIARRGSRTAIRAANKALGELAEARARLDLRRCAERRFSRPRGGHAPGGFGA